MAVQQPSHLMKRILSWYTDQLRELFAAMRFLTIIPLPGSAFLFKTDHIGERVFFGSAYFPLVGAVLAVLLSLFVIIMVPWIPPLVLTALLVIGRILFTGGLHLDGLMDCCDGLFGGRTRERKLEIMRDSRVGSFGVLGAVALLLLSFACFASLPIMMIPWILIMSMPIARWTMVLALFSFPPARSSGLGMVVRISVTFRRCVFAGVSALFLAVCGGWFAAGWFGCAIGMLFWLLAVIFTLVSGRWITNQLGGLTGDVYGALAETCELFCLLIAVLIWHLS